MSIDNLLWDAFRGMLTIRVVEERFLELFAAGELHGTVHTCIGQEGCAVAVIGSLDPERDTVVSNHRGHGHYLVHSRYDLDGLIGEVTGRASGVSAGVGGTQQLHRKNFYSIGIQGGLVPAAVGMAFAEKLTGSRNVVCVCIGDGTLGQGVVYESMNIASKWSLPILFVVEANSYAQSTPTEVQHAGSLVGRATAFGIESFEMQADDVAAMRDRASKVVSQMRVDRRPVFLVLRTYRLGPHSKGDDHRPKEELDAHWARDPLSSLRAKLQAIDEGRMGRTEQVVKGEVDAAFRRVLASPARMGSGD